MPEGNTAGMREGGQVGKAVGGSVHRVAIYRFSWGSWEAIGRF